MEDEEEISTPFWAQSSSHRRRSSSVFLNSGLLLFTLCIAFSLFFYLLSPTLNPNLFKKSWDSLNLTLVLLALIFGFLSRNINYDDLNGCSNSNGVGNEVVRSSGSTPRGWFECSDRTVVGLRRSYSSYPNLREVGDGGERWQFYDDMSLTRTASPRVRPVVNGGDRWQFYDGTSLTRSASPRARRVANGGDRWRLYEPDEATVVSPVRSVSRTGDRWRFDDGVAIATRAEEALKVSPVRPAVDTGTVRVGEGAGGAKNNDDLGFESRLDESGCFLVGEYDREAISDTGDSVLAEKERIIDENRSKRPVVRRIIVDLSEQSSSSEPLDGKRYDSSSRKRDGNATKHFIDSFRKKKKKQRQKSVDSLDTLPRNFFSSKKNKKTISVLSPPPPPPPPPPQFFSAHAQRSAAATLTASAAHQAHSDEGGESPLSQIPSPPPFFMAQKAQKSAPTVAASRSLLPAQSRDGGESPLCQIPPPPPPPPFKMVNWKFVVKGDYVRIGSMGSSSDEGDFSPKSSESGWTPTERDDKERGREGGMFCPSPDVNSKADMFIAKFRAGLKLQKMNSMNLKQGLGLSNLGPTTKT